MAMTLEQVKELVAQLPPQEQLKLMAHISGQLSQPPPSGQESRVHRPGRDYAARVEEFLAACDQLAEQIEGEFDAAEDLRQIREERAERL